MNSKLIKIIKRDDCDFELAFHDIEGNPINLTSAMVFFTVKKNPTDADSAAVIKKDITSFSNPSEGLAALTLTHTDTNIDVGSYYFDVQLKNADGTITSSHAGRFLVIQDVTERTS